MTVSGEMKDFLEGKEGLRHVPAPKLVEWAQRLATSGGDKDGGRGTKTQLRRYYDAIRTVWDVSGSTGRATAETPLDEALVTRLIFLKPVFYGAAKRNKIGEDFSQAMQCAIGKIKTRQDLYKLFKFYEAILQYSE